MKSLLFALSMVLVPHFALGAESREFAEKVVAAHKLSGAQADNLIKILTMTYGLTRNIGTEDPNVLQGPNNSWHMTTRKACIDKVIKTGLIKQNPEFERVCGAPWMAPIGNGVCMDQFEFPNMPCEYPVVWITSAIAHRVCSAMGKRVCNSHEWEGACMGRPRGPESYAFNIADRGARKAYTNNKRELVWAFQWIEGLKNLKDTRGVCGVYASDDLEIAEPMRSNPNQYFSSIGKSKTCNNGAGSAYQTCGTNSWPSGFKHMCKSEFDIYDLHGNLAEVTNLPENPSQIADMQGRLGGTERKGSFFVYRGDYPDDCLVRQPYEHYGPYATDKMSYYQEGFRCCKDVP